MSQPNVNQPEDQRREAETLQDPRTCCPPYDINDPAQQELSNLIRPLKMDPMGVVSLGRDGVYRSLSAGLDEVVDAVGLSPWLIEALFKRLPPGLRAEHEGADGTNVPREQWFHPDKSKLPQTTIQREARGTEEGNGGAEEGKE
uniref:Uncharacterized protein n=1 Tax=Coccidioides posadasii RMSCC 3488 TaxID=454284 RepID=A0A0J6F4J8_COCPO|nr:hypothetical protein CPAG_04174 [Coccidioides posadasii RMSCC 3488]